MGSYMQIVQRILYILYITYNNRYILVFVVVDFHSSIDFTLMA